LTAAPIILITGLVLSEVLFPGTANAEKQFTLTPRISLQEQYDDNIGLRPENEVSDWITVVGPGLSLLVETPHTKLNLDYEAGFTFYLRDTFRNRTRHRGRGTWDQQLVRNLSLQLNNTFLVSEDPITVQEGQIVDIATERVTRYRNSGQAGLSWRFGTEDRISAGYRSRLFESESSREQDSMGHEGFADLETWFVPTFGMGLNARLNRTQFRQPNEFVGIGNDDFYQSEVMVTANYRRRRSRVFYARYRLLFQDFEETFGGAFSDDYVVHEGVLGLSHRLSRRTNFRAKAGYFFQDFEDRKGRDGPAFDARFDTRGKRASLQLGVDGGFWLDYYSSQNRGFSQFAQVSGSADYALTEDLRILARASYRYEDFTEVDEIDRTWFALGGLAWSPFGWLRLSLDGRHSERASNVPGREFTDNRVTLRITASYPWEIR
jgi:hypothetical protein